MHTQSSSTWAHRPWARITLLVLGGVGLLWAAGSGRAHPPAAGPPAVRVVVSSRALAESTTLTRADVHTVEVGPSPVTLALSGDLASVVGRRLLVPVAAGAPLSPGVLGAPSPAQPPARLVPLSIAADRLAGQIRMGDQIDLVAAEPAAGGAPGGRVDLVASGRLVSVSGHRGPAPAEPASGGDLVLLVACDEVAAMRLLWAQSFGHSLTALARPEGARPLAASSGGGT